MNSMDTENLVGRKLQKDLCDFCSEAMSRFKTFPFLKEKEHALSDLQKSILHPFNIAIFGRMKTGKSTLINALTGDELAITDVEEATATINVIVHSESPDEQNRFKVHWKDKPPEQFPLKQLKEKWTGKTPEVLENIRRTSYIELYSPLHFLKLCEITDTPGMGSEVSEHEEITKNFLNATQDQNRKADAIIYVFPPVGRESDKENLDAFREKNCVPGSDPYNSVAVLHKWDYIYWQNGGDFDEINHLAQKLFTAIKSTVKAVIPVSAPLALASQKAPECFFTQIADLCSRSSWNDLENLLSRDTKWDRDGDRKNIRNSYPSLPWPTFQIIVREIARHKEEFSSDIQAWRDHLRKLSGIDSLLSFLDTNFFKRSELIRQKRIYKEIQRIYKDSDGLIKKKIKTLDNDIHYWDVLFDTDFEKKSLTTWLSEKRFEARKEKEKIFKTHEDLDALFLNSPIPKLIQDEDTLSWCENWCEKEKNKFSQEQLSLIRKIFDFFAGDPNTFSGDSREEFQAIKQLQTKASELCVTGAEKTIRDNAQHIKERVDEFITLFSKQQPAKGK